MGNNTQFPASVFKAYDIRGTVPDLIDAPFARSLGVALSGGCLLITAFLVCAAIDPDLFAWIKDFSITPIGTAILFAWSLALYYHTCNGIRHLIWDTVHLLDERKAVISGWIVLLATAALTAATWYFASIY